MDYIYLGLFSKIFNWVFEKILSPVFEFVAKLIGDVVSWAFNEILAPIIKSVLVPIVKMVLELIIEIFADFFYILLAKVLQFVDALTKICDIIIGAEPVIYKPDPSMKYSLLEVLMFKTSIGNIFWYINLIGLLLTMTFAIIAVARSAADLEMDSKRPVGRVMGSTLKAFLNLMTVNFVVYLIVRLSGAILESIKIAFEQTPIVEGGAASTGATLGSMVFAMCTLNAAKNGFNADSFDYHSGDYLSGIGPNVMDDVRRDFFLNIKSYNNIDMVKGAFKTGKLDFLTGYIAAIFLVIMLAAISLVFVRRIYDMLLLYISVPFFISTMPFDDGQKFAKWREVYLGKTFSGYGMLMSMKLYMILCPNVMSGSIHFSTSSMELDYLTKIMFLLGGAWAVLKSGTLLTTLISQEAGHAEQETAVAGAAAGIFTSKLGAKGVFKATKFAGSKVWNGVTGGGKPDTKNVGGGRGGGGGGGGLAGGMSAGVGGGKGDGNGTKDAKPQPQDSRKMSGASAFQASKFTSKKKSASTASKGGTSGAKTSSVSAGNGGKGADGKEGGSFFKEHNDFKLQKSGLLFNTYKDSNGNTRTGFNFSLGKLVGVKRDHKGTSVSLAGFRLRWGTDGKINKVQIPFAKWKTANDGKLHCARWSAAGLVNVKADTVDGTLQLRSITPIGLRRDKASDGTYHVSDVGLVGLHREEGSDGDFHMSRLGIFGIQREEQENGEYRITSAAGGLYQQSFALGEDGKTLSNAGVRAFGLNWKIDHNLADHNQLVNLNDNNVHVTPKTVSEQKSFLNPNDSGNNKPENLS